MSTQRTTKISDWEAAHRAVEQVYFPHELTALSSPDQLELNLQTVDLGPVTIGRLNWGDRCLHSLRLSRRLRDQHPPRQRCPRVSCRVGSHDVGGRSGHGVHRRPAVAHHPMVRRLPGRRVKFDAEYLEREADRVRAAPLRSQLLLPHQLDLTGPDEQSWFALVRALSAQLREPADLLANPLVGPQLASAVSSAFILAVSPEEAGTGLRPRMVKRVLDALHDDPARDWRLADMAEIGGRVSGDCRRASPSMSVPRPPRCCATSV